MISVSITPKPALTCQIQNKGYVPFQPSQYCYVPKAIKSYSALCRHGWLGAFTKTQYKSETIHCSGLVLVYVVQRGPGVSLNSTTPLADDDQTSCFWLKLQPWTLSWPSWFVRPDSRDVDDLDDGPGRRWPPLPDGLRETLDHACTAFGALTGAGLSR